MKANARLVDAVKGVPLFRKPSETPELENILKPSRVAEFDADHDIVEEAGGFVGLHLILDGKATVSQASRPIARFGSGDCFGEIRLIDGQTCLRR